MNEVETKTKTRNADVIQGLRDLADYLEAHDEIPKVGEFTVNAPISQKQECGDDYWQMSAEQKHGPLSAKLARVAQLPGTWFKNGTDYHYTVRRQFGPITLEVYTDRESICRKVTVMKEIEVTEWQCDPILEALEEVPA